MKSSEGRRWPFARVSRGPPIRRSIRRILPIAVVACSASASRSSAWRSASVLPRISIAAPVSKLLTGASIIRWLHCPTPYLRGQSQLESGDSAAPAAPGQRFRCGERRELYRLQRNWGAWLANCFFPASARRAKKFARRSTTQPPPAPAGAAALPQASCSSTSVSRGTRPACLRSRPRRRERRPSLPVAIPRQSRCRGRRPPAHFHRGIAAISSVMDWGGCAAAVSRAPRLALDCLQGLSAHIRVRRFLPYPRSAGRSGVWRDLCARLARAGVALKFLDFRRRLGRAVRWPSSRRTLRPMLAQSARRCDRWVATCSSSRDARWSAQPAVLLTRALYTSTIAQELCCSRCRDERFPPPCAVMCHAPCDECVRPVESSGLVKRHTTHPGMECALTSWTRLRNW